MKKRFTILRSGEAPDILESGIMEVKERPEGRSAAMLECVKAGLEAGSQARVIFAGFGLSLIHMWFKRSFPLPLHSHDADCLYYILGGGLRLGTEDLQAGDAFFVPANAPYTYTPGVDGVELIEVRNREAFDYREKSGDAFWRKALKTVEKNRAAWSNASRFIDIERQKPA